MTLDSATFCRMLVAGEADLSRAAWGRIEATYALEPDREARFAVVSHEIDRATPCAQQQGEG